MASKHFVFNRTALQTALVSLFAIAGVCSSASAATIIVDDDRVQAPTAPFTNIQDAVNFASNGDTIYVYPGVYAGKITVSKSLILQGAGADFTRDTAPAAGLTNATVDSIVLNAGQGGFIVNANNVTIRNFRIVGNATPTTLTYPDAAVYVKTGSGRTLTYNVFENSRLGVYAEGAQATFDVNINAFYNNKRSDANPSGGLFSAGGALNTTTIRNNRFSGNGQFSVNVGGGSTTGLNINNNVANAEWAFVIIGNTTSAKIQYNTATNLSSSGVYTYGNNTGLAICQNTLSGIGPNQGIGSGIRVNPGYGTTLPDVAPRILNNTISNFRWDGISFNGATGGMSVSIADNTIFGNGGYGIWLQNASGLKFTSNIIQNNGEIGIRVESVSLNNTFTTNTMTNNPLDASDATTGSKTAGTANTWTSNTGTTSNPAGLVTPPAP